MVGAKTRLSLKHIAVSHKDGQLRTVTAPVQGDEEYVETSGAMSSVRRVAVLAGSRIALKASARDK